MNILITAATIPAAHRLRNQLSAEHILMGDYLELPAFMLLTGKMLQLPSPASIAYVHEMLTLCLDREIDTVYLFRPEEIKLLNAASRLFAEYGVSLITVTDEV